MGGVSGEVAGRLRVGLVGVSGEAAGRLRVAFAVAEAAEELADGGVRHRCALRAACVFWYSRASFAMALRFAAVFFLACARGLVLEDAQAPLERGTSYGPIARPSHRI
jgi:hypothetical protein